MALPTPTQLKTMDIGYNAEPFVWVQTKGEDTGTMDVGYQAQPFVVNYEATTTTTWVPRIMFF